MAEQFGEFYRIIRESMGLTQSELAERLECSISTISRMENGRAIRGNLAENLPKVLPVPDYFFAWTEEDEKRRELYRILDETIAESNTEKAEEALCELMCLQGKDRLINRQYFEMYKALWNYLLTRDEEVLEKQVRLAINLTCDFDGVVSEIRTISRNLNYGTKVRTLNIHKCISKFRGRVCSRVEIILLNAYAVSKAQPTDTLITRFVFVELLLKIDENKRPEWEGMYNIILYNLAYAHYVNRTYFEADSICKKLLKQRRIRENHVLFSKAIELDDRIVWAIKNRGKRVFHHGVFKPEAIYIPETNRADTTDYMLIG